MVTVRDLMRLVGRLSLPRPLRYFQLHFSTELCKDKQILDLASNQSYDGQIVLNQKTKGGTDMVGRESPSLQWSGDSVVTTPN